VITQSGERQVEGKKKIPGGGAGFTDPVCINGLGGWGKLGGDERETFGKP